MTCLAACTLSDIYGHVLNAQVISALSVSAPIARDVIYLASRAIPLLAIAFIVPLILSPKTAKRLSAASGVLAVAGCALMFTSLAMPQGATTLITFAFALLCIGGTWYNTLPILMLCRLTSFGNVALCACVAYAVSGIVSSAVDTFGLDIQYALLGLLPLAQLALANSSLHDYADLNARSTHIRELELQNAHSFVSVTNPAFICVFIFHCVSGFALALNCVSGVPVHSILPSVLVVAFVGAAFLWSREHAAVDSIAGIAAFCVICGFLTAIVFINQAPVLASNIALTTGSGLLSILETLIMVSMGKRNPIGALRVIALGKTFTTAGALVGSASGHFINAATVSNQLVATSSIAVILLMFLILSYVWLRRFTFEKLIFEVEPVRAVEPLPTPPDELQSKCAVAAEKYGLTKREVEICQMLASGMTGKDIEQTCVISYNTVKTHVKHIYTKLDIHSQQELIELIDKL
ncbi:hypothetical protein DMP06_04860 [Slackia equolifaciens]|uniref:HTH luxR-type domain-containing protein n=1 Tax=Slackia equolifaciens TaxID=498718 RepID=A0A3N0B1K6_9ACTN|nr:hypothetical protein DMP06_04860 [Slackia equolifaciens]